MSNNNSSNSSPSISSSSSSSSSSNNSSSNNSSSNNSSLNNSSLNNSDDKIQVQYSDYLHNLNNEINRLKDTMVVMKYNILYNIINPSEDLSEYTEIESKLNSLLDIKKKIVLTDLRNKESIEEELNELGDQKKLLLSQYNEINEITVDKKDLYKQIKELDSELFSKTYSNIELLKIHDNEYKLFKRYSVETEKELTIPKQDYSF